MLLSKCSLLCTNSSTLVIGELLCARLFDASFEIRFALHNDCFGSERGSRCCCCGWICNDLQYVQKSLRKINKSSNVKQNRKMLIFVYAYFLRTSAKNLFLKAGLGAGMCLHADVQFSKYFPRLSSFGNTWGNTCIKFFAVDIKFHFTCGEWNLY